MIPDKQKQSLYELYTSLFECVVADTDELIDECYKLRYHVYCLENEFETPNPELGEYERDEYDGHSIHALLRYRRTGEYIGTVRLIIGDKDSPKRMPVLQLCEDNHIFLPEHLYREPSAEISRFCISKTFRRRVTDTLYSSAYSPRELVEMRSRIIPCMAVGMMAMLLKLCRARGILQPFAVVEPSLVRLLDKLGIHFNPVGEPVDYHGTRLVTYIHTEVMMEQIKTERTDVYELMDKLS